MIAPVEVTVAGWHVAQVAIVVAVAWLAVAGGTAWQVPHATTLVSVHTGCDDP